MLEIFLLNTTILFGKAMFPFMSHSEQGIIFEVCCTSETYSEK
jgi:hypothetical protein